MQITVIFDAIVFLLFNSFFPFAISIARHYRSWSINRLYALICCQLEMHRKHCRKKKTKTIYSSKRKNRAKVNYFDAEQLTFVHTFHLHNARTPFRLINREKMQSEKKIVLHCIAPLTECRSVARSECVKWIAKLKIIFMNDEESQVKKREFHLRFSSNSIEDLWMNNKKIERKKKMNVAMANLYCQQSSLIRWIILNVSNNFESWTSKHQQQ